MWCTQPGEGLTAVRFDGAGLTAAVGTTNGLVALFDLRTSRPTLVKDHMYGAPIRDIKFHAIDGLAGDPSLPSARRRHACAGHPCTSVIPFSSPLPVSHTTP